MREGVHIYEISALLGHKDVGTTVAYLGTTGERSREAVNKLNRYDESATDVQQETMDREVQQNIIKGKVDLIGN